MISKSLLAIHPLYIWFNRCLGCETRPVGPPDYHLQLQTKKSYTKRGGQGINVKCRVEWKLRWFRNRAAVVLYFEPLAVTKTAAGEHTETLLSLLPFSIMTMMLMMICFNKMWKQLKSGLGSWCVLNDVVVLLLYIFVVHLVLQQTLINASSVVKVHGWWSCVKWRWIGRGNRWQ